MAAQSRRMLGTLFLFLAVFFVGIAYAGARAGGIAFGIGIAAAILALWIGSLGLRALLMRRAR